jgi:chromosome segregation ATPase
MKSKSHWRAQKRAELHERLEEAREKVEEQLALIDEKERNVARLDQEIETLRPTVYKTAGLRGGNNEYRNAQDDTVPAVQV